MKLPAIPKRSKSVVIPAGGKATPQAPSNEAFEKEVDEELQREWLNELWEKYGVYLLGAAVALVLGVGAYKLNEQRRQSAAEAEGARYVAAVKELAEGKTDAGTQALAALAKTGDGVSVMARLRLAAANVTAGKNQDAIATYDSVAHERGVDPILADYARLQTAALSLDTAPLADMQAKLTPLLSENNPWRFNAMELLGLAALKAGKTDEARVQFEKLISDQGVPQGMAERARIVMGSIIEAELATKSAPQAQPVSPQAPPAPAAPANSPPTVAPAPAAPPVQKK